MHVRHHPGVGAQPVRWVVEQPAAIVGAPSQQSARWAASLASADGALRLGVRGEWQFDAQAFLELTLSATRDVALDDVELLLPLVAARARHVMGFGEAGGLLEGRAPIRWRWEEGLGNYLVWLGDAAAGVRLRLTGSAPGFESPQHLMTASDIPDGWHNGGHGGAVVGADGSVRAFSGARALRAGESVELRFELLLTPCKPLVPSAHWGMRYYQVGYPDTALVQPDEVARQGARVINIHQGVDGLVNPYINYPFGEAAHHMAKYTARAHALGLRVKTYYTIRELSNHAEELWVLRSLGDEVLTDGHGGGDPWANEHLASGYRACWQNPLSNGEFDSALCDRGLSRWANYYIEGLRELARPPVQLDGIYYDGIAFGSDTMRRVRHVLDSERPGSLIDLHCGNNLPGSTYGHVSPALQFMHLFPYVDSLWFGEGYDYNSSPDYWLVEVSGVAWGLMGDMMREGNPWRGMLYGMTTRPRCADPSSVWALWDAFGIQRAEMIGYWDAAAPVRARCECDPAYSFYGDGAGGAQGRAPCGGVLATSYVVRGNATLVALASWAPTAAHCELDVEWARLGLHPRQAAAHAPRVAGFQDASEMTITAARTLRAVVQPARGALIVITGA